GIDPEMVEMLRVAGGDMAGEALIEAEFRKEPQPRRQALLAMQALLGDRAAASRLDRRGAPASQAAPGGGAAALFEIRLRSGPRRPYHRPRPGASRPFLGQSLRQAFFPDRRLR